MNLESIMLVEEIKHMSYFYEALKTGKSIETERRLMVASGVGEGKREINCLLGTRFPFMGNKNSGAS